MTTQLSSTPFAFFVAFAFFLQHGLPKQVVVPEQQHVVASSSLGFFRRQHPQHPTSGSSWGPSQQLDPWQQSSLQQSLPQHVISRLFSVQFRAHCPQLLIESRPRAPQHVPERRRRPSVTSQGPGGAPARSVSDSDAVCGSLAAAPLCTTATVIHWAPILQSVTVSDCWSILPPAAPLPGPDHRPAVAEGRVGLRLTPREIQSK
jgi:hypothetical protein